jgi:NADH-quinone oxidoreductase subunit F
MTNFEKIRENAKRKWESLHSSKIPIIYIGTATCGLAAGAKKVLQAVKSTLREYQLNARIIEVGCIGPCYLEPLMDIKLPGFPRISYSSVTPEKAMHIIQNSLIKGDPVLKYAVGYLGENGQAALRDLPRLFDIPMLKPQVRVVLRNCGFIDPNKVEHYIAMGGYSGLQNALRLGPESIIAEIKAAGLRGRGGAGFPTYKKWEI